MDNLLKICEKLDLLNYQKDSDTIFFKLASKQSILKKRILIPSDVQKNAEKAYKDRYKNLVYGNQSMFEIAKDLYTRVYLDLEDVLKIHKYTMKHRFSKSSSKKQPSYWEYELHGGEEGRIWASNIIRIYLPEKWISN